MPPSSPLPRVRLLCLLLCYSLVSPSALFASERTGVMATTSASRAAGKRASGRGASSSSTAPSKARPSQDSPAVAAASRAGELLVRFKAEAAENSVNALLESKGLRRGKTLRGESGVERLAVALDRDVEALAAEMRADSSVSFAEPNYIITADQGVTPSDPRFSEQWALRDPVSTTGIGAGRAWETTVGSRRTVVAVIDSGIDFTHPDLRRRRWENAGEKTGGDGDGVDDDGNIYTDDTSGWDWVNDDGLIKDESGHGTAVAGVIAAQGNNAEGISGVMWRASLMSLRVLDSTGRGDVASAVEALDYATWKGAHIVNLSWGTEGKSQSLREAIERAISKGAVVVCSAGNGGRDVEASPRYPASFDTTQLITVAATDDLDQLSSSSNWGARSVTLAAPGVNVLSTKAGGDYQPFGGTSAAAAVVSGVAGLIKTLRPRLSAAKTREVITTGARSVFTLQGRVSTGAVVSAAGALVAESTLPPHEGLDTENTDEDQNKDQDDEDDGTAANPEANRVGVRTAPIASSRGTRVVGLTGAPASNLPDLDVERNRPAVDPVVVAPVPSTMKRCPPRNPRCNSPQPMATPVLSPLPSPSPSPSPTPSPSPQSSPTPYPSPLPSPVPLPYPAPTPSPLSSPLPTPSPLPSPSPMASPLATPPLIGALLQTDADPYAGVLLARGVTDLALEQLMSSGSAPDLSTVMQDYLRGDSRYSVTDASAPPLLLSPRRDYGGSLAPLALLQSANASAFVSQSLPTLMTVGQTYGVSVTMRNTGTNTWTTASNHHLGSQNPQDNNTWGAGGRVALPATTAPNAEVTFSFNVVAPSTPGTYNFQWRMVQDGVEWFGAYSTNVAVVVSAGGGGGGTTYNAVSDFSATQNPSAPWGYGYKPSGGSYTAYAGTSTGFGAGTQTWALAGQTCCPMVTKNTTGATYPYPAAPSVVQPADVLNLHPGASGERSVVRWAAPAAGTYTITGRFEGIDTAGTTTDVVITHNGTSVFSGNVSGHGAQVPFSVSRTVSAGDIIEFSAGYGANGTYNQDSTGLAATITQQGGGRTNVALASQGATATASSEYSSNYPASSVTNGDRRGQSWGAGGGWNDAAPVNAFPDWVQVDFSGSKIIDEIDVFTVQDAYANPSEPTEAQTFTLYGLTGYEVQYWTGSAWANVTGGSVTGNNKVWRKFNFSPVTTTKVRVLTNAAVDGISRLVEVEAYEASPRTNFALSANGGAASASSHLSDPQWGTYPPSAVIDGSRRGPSSGTLWLDNTFNTWPDWVEVSFSGQKTIDEVVVVTQQDDTSGEPTEAQTFALYGATGFDVQYWTSGAWATVPGGSVTGNNKVIRKVAFAPVTTSKIRVVVNAGVDNAFSRIVEVEAWGAAAGTPAEPGTGLRGKYFDGPSFNDFRLARTDQTVNFDWGTGAPHASMAADSYSVQWTGQVKPLYSEAYTFYTQSDDGVRLWVNGQLLFDKWNVQALTEHHNIQPITLLAGQSYDIKLEYFEEGGFSVAKLLWESTSQTKQIIPQSQLYGCWKTTDQFVKVFYDKMLTRQPNSTELQSWVDRLAQAQGGAALLGEAQALGRSLYYSAEYTNRNRTNQEFVGDLYRGYMQREPDGAGWDYWTGVVNSDPVNGRENVRRGFEQNGEFTGKVDKLCGTSSSTGGGYNFSETRLDANNRTGGGGTDLQSRNYNWTLPLVGLAGRAGLDLGLSLSYNSLVWTKDGAGTAVSFDADHGFPSPGFRLGFPTVQPRFLNSQTSKYAYLLITPSGERVELRQVGTSNTYESADSSYLQLVDYGGGSLALWATDGTRLSFWLMSSGDYQCTEVKDRNGNYLSIAYDGNGQLRTVTDTLARVVTFNYDAYQNLVSIKQPWKRERLNGSLVETVTEEHTWATFGYTNQTINRNFGSLTVIGPASGEVMPVLSQVGLSDGSYYKFAYTPWGQVNKITHYAADSVVGGIAQDTHALSYTLYDLPTGTGAQSDCPRFTSRTDWIENGMMGENGSMTTSYNEWSPNLTQGDATMPDGTTKHVEKYAAASPAWKRGLVTDTEVWSGGVKKKWTTLAWTQDDTNVAYRLNPRVIESNVHDSDGNQRRTGITYTSYGLPSEATEYAADASSVLRRTQTDYNLDAAYTSRRIIGLTSERRVYDGANALVSKADFRYDWATVGGVSYLQAQGAAVQHDGVNYGVGFTTGRGNLASARRWNINAAADAAQAVESNTGYNTHGSAIFSRDPLGHQASLSYTDSYFDDINRNTFAYPTSVTDPDNFSSTSKYNYDLGAPVRSLDPKGAQSSTLFDKAGRAERVTRRDTVIGQDRGYTRIVYPEHMGLVQTFTQIETGVETYSARRLDGAGRVRGTSRDLPGSVGGYSSQMVKYDVMGRVVAQSNPVETDGSWQVTGDDLAVGWVFTTQNYDWQGRPETTTNVDGTTRVVSYGGCGCAGGAVVTVAGEVVMLPPQGGAGAWVEGRRRRKTTHDVLGRAVKSEILNNDGTAYMTTVTEYNARDQVIGVKEYKGAAAAGGACPLGTCQQTTMGYDGHGRMSSSKSPEQTKATIYTYHHDDTTDQVTDARDVVTTYGFTNAAGYTNKRHLVNSLTYTNAPAGVPPTPQMRYEYDARGNRTSMSDGTGSVSYSYDVLSRMESETRTFAGLAGSYALSYTYNFADQLKTLTDSSAPSAMTITYGYDSAGQLSGVTGTPYGSPQVSAYASGMKYRAWGAVKEMTYGDGLRMSVGYNARLQVAQYRVGQPNTQPGAGDLALSDYEYEADGRIKRAFDRTDERFNRTYSYDLVGRLSNSATSAAASYQSFSYDEFNHLTARGNGSWRYHDTTISEYRDNRNTQTTFYPPGAQPQPSVWTYNAEGEVVRDHNKEYTFDAAGEKTSVLETTQPTLGQTQRLWIHQSYDADGERVKRVEQTQYNAGAITTTPVYYVRSSVLDGGVVTELDGSGAKKQTYVYANGKVIAQQKDNQVKWVHVDPVTSSLRETNASGSTVERKEFDPLGNDVPLQDPAPPDNPSPDYLYNGTYAQSGNPYDGASGCSIDGQPMDCSFAVRLISTGRGLSSAVSGSVAGGSHVWVDEWEDFTEAAGEDDVFSLGDGGNVGYQGYAGTVGSRNVGGFRFVQTGTVRTSVTPLPQNPAQQLFDAGVKELKKRLEERSDCAKLFGRLKKALKVFDKINFKFGPLEEGVIAETVGSNVTINPKEFTEAGGVLAISQNIKEFKSGAMTRTTHSAMSVTLTGVTYAAFVLFHEFGHKSKIFDKKYDKDGTQGSKYGRQLELGANNEKIRQACFSELQPQ